MSSSGVVVTGILPNLSTLNDGNTEGTGGGGDTSGGSGDTTVTVIGAPLTENQEAAIIEDQNETEATGGATVSTPTGGIDFPPIKQEQKKYVYEVFEKESRTYWKNRPELLFAAEYYVTTPSNPLKRQFAGVLVVWEKFRSSSHYEVFRRNVFTDSKFERILFLDTPSLEDEKKYFLDYLKVDLGLNGLDGENILMMLDTRVKKDRIYEYQVTAARVPRDATEVDYDSVMKRNKQISRRALSNPQPGFTIFDFAGSVMGNRDMAWIVALLNDRLPYFGKAGQDPLFKWQVPEAPDPEDVTAIPILNVPSESPNQVLCIIQNTVALFGAKETFDVLLSRLGGLPAGDRSQVVRTIDDSRSVFSYDAYISNLAETSQVLNLYTELIESTTRLKREFYEQQWAVLNPAAVVAARGNFIAQPIEDTEEAWLKFTPPGSIEDLERFSSLPVHLPQISGVEKLSSIEEITKVLKFINDTWLLVAYYQEPTTYETLFKVDAVTKNRFSALQDLVSSGAIIRIEEVLDDPSAFAIDVNVIREATDKEQEDQGVTESNPWWWSSYQEFFDGDPFDLIPDESEET